MSIDSAAFIDDRLLGLRKLMADSRFGREDCDAGEQQLIDECSTLHAGHEIMYLQEMLVACRIDRRRFRDEYNKRLAEMADHVVMSDQSNSHSRLVGNIVTGPAAVVMGRIAVAIRGWTLWVIGEFHRAVWGTEIEVARPSNQGLLKYVTTLFERHPPPHADWIGRCESLNRKLRAGRTEWSELATSLVWKILVTRRYPAVNAAYILQCCNVNLLAYQVLSMQIANGTGSYCEGEELERFLSCTLTSSGVLPTGATILLRNVILGDCAKVSGTTEQLDVASQRIVENVAEWTGDAEVVSFVRGATVLLQNQSCLAVAGLFSDASMITHFSERVRAIRQSLRLLEANKIS